ncbi:hypothetical protein [Caldithrix abyssi]
MNGQLADFKVPKGRNDYSETVSTVYANEQQKKSFIKGLLREMPNIVGEKISARAEWSAAPHSNPLKTKKDRAKALSFKYKRF